MERDRCYYISDKKPRRDRVRWEGHTEKVEEQLLKRTALAPAWKKWETMLCRKLILSLLWRMQMINP